MPELPEVETTRRGIHPHLLHRSVRKVVVRQGQLRWPVPAELPARLAGQIILSVDRRAKYLLLRTDRGTVLIHLGMSGSLRLLPTGTPPGKHDHVDLELDSGQSLRLTDPRRFGAVLWTETPPEEHPLLRELGPEPLGDDFHGDYLFSASRGRKVAVKQFLMDGHVVVGVGNIYANESLFLAGIRPTRAAGSISRARYERLAETVKEVLGAAISQGGTTLRDFVGGDGKPGYFAQQLRVYGRTGLPCIECGRTLRQLQLGQRSTFYCPGCQR